MAENLSQTNYDIGILCFASGRVLSSETILPEKDICLACPHVLLSAICEERITEFSGRLGRGKIQEMLLEYIPLDINNERAGR